MQTLNKEELTIYRKDFFEKVNSGKVFIHPTDTIYGLGCDATSYDAVKRLREAKERASNPFSVIAPSKDWIKANCEVSEELLGNLPGPVTLILKLKNKNAVADNVNNGLATLGVRIPDHWISVFVKELGKPVITTSVNLQGEEHMTKIENINPKIKGKIDFAIYEGEKIGHPSKIINAVENKVIER
jgi:tRNA threonylcarbamoyl adenosine modification protein (Sua5/YciO/YrdC/YwlC family)